MAPAVDEAAADSGASDTKPTPLELWRQNRKQNAAILSNFEKDVSGAVKNLTRAPPPRVTPTKSASRPKRRSAAHVDSAADDLPKRVTRSSARLSGGGDGDGDTKRPLDSLDGGAPAPREAKKARINGDLSLGDITVSGRAFSDGVGGLSGLSFRGAEPGLKTFDADAETTDEDVKKARKMLQGLALYDKWAVNDIKITPMRVYSMGFHPTEDKPIIFGGDKEGAMGIFDASQAGPEYDEDDENPKIEPPQISAFNTHARTISSIHFSPTDANAVYSASYDSSIRKLDIEKLVSTQVYAPDDASDEQPISAMDMAPADGNVVYFSTLHGALGRHDLRMPSSKGAEIWQLHDDKIGGFSLHPGQPHLVATASLDRTMCLWDLRRITGKGEARAPAEVGSHASPLSVSHAAWSPAGHVATSSYDNTVKIYDFSASAASWPAGHALAEADMEPAHVVEHNNQTGRWVTILKPQWQRRPADGVLKFAIANMNRFVDVFGADGSQLAQLDGEGITAVPAVAVLHPTRNWVVGGTGSGKVALWM